MYCSCFSSLMFFYLDFLTLCCLKVQAFCRVSLFSSVTVPRANLERQRRVTPGYILHQAGQQLGLAGIVLLLICPLHPLGTAPRWNPVCVLSGFCCVWLYVTPRTAAYQAPLSMGLPGSSTGVGCQALLQGIFPTQGWNRCLMSPALAHWFFSTSAI